jgi:hypothetical protein
MRNLNLKRKTIWLAVLTAALALALLIVFLYMFRSTEAEVESLPSPQFTKSRAPNPGIADRGALVTPPATQIETVSPEYYLDKSWKLAQQANWPPEDRAHYLLLFCQTASFIRSKRYPNACQDSFAFAEHYLSENNVNHFKLSHAPTFY